MSEGVPVPCRRVVGAGVVGAGVVGVGGFGCGGAWAVTTEAVATLVDACVVWELSLVLVLSVQLCQFRLCESSEQMNITSTHFVAQLVWK